MNLPYPVVLKPEHQPLLAQIIFLLVYPYLLNQAAKLDSTPNLLFVGKLAEVAWNLSRLEGDPEAEEIAREMRASLDQRFPGLGLALDDLLARSRLVKHPDAPLSEYVSIAFEKGRLIILAVPRAPRRGPSAEFH